MKQMEDSIKKNWLFFFFKCIQQYSKVMQQFALRESVRIRSFSGPCFPAFGLNMERYPISLRIQSECGKMRTRKTPNMDTFHAIHRMWHHLWINLFHATGVFPYPLKTPEKTPENL